jgi:transposase
LHAAEQNRPDVAQARRRWQRGQGQLDPARLVFIDESAAKTNLTRTHGRAPRGERLVCHAPHGHWRTTTMISSVRLDGTSTCMTIEGATNIEVFQAYVRAVLVPSLRPGDIVVLDNLSAHKNQRTLELISQAGAQFRFLPAYSPDLNPIEMMWSKVKALLRTAQARSHPKLLKAIAAAHAAITPQDSRGWFTACGYSFI